MGDKDNFMTVWILSKRLSENHNGEDVLSVFSGKPTNEQLTNEGLDEYDAEQLIEMQCSYWYVLREYRVQYPKTTKGS